MKRVDKIVYPDHTLVNLHTTALQAFFATVTVIFLRRRRNLRRVPTTEEKPEVPISRDVKGISGLGSGLDFEGFFERS